MSPATCELLQDTNPAELHAFCLFEVLEHLQSLFDEQTYADEIDRMHMLIKKLNAFFPNLAKFDGTKSMNHSLMKAFNSLGLIEAVAVQLLAIFEEVFAFSDSAHIADDLLCAHYH